MLFIWAIFENCGIICAKNQTQDTMNNTLMNHLILFKNVVKKNADIKKGTIKKTAIFKEYIFTFPFIIAINPPTITKKIFGVTNTNHCESKRLRYGTASKKDSTKSTTYLAPP